MFVYDKTFDPKVVLHTFDPNKLIGHCDLISRFSDFDFYLDTQLVYFCASFRLIMSMARALTPNILIVHCNLMSRFSDFALYLDTQLYIFILLLDYEYV